MSSKEGLYTLFFSGILSIIVTIVTGCAPKTGHWESELLYKKDEIDHNKLTTGNSILLLPVIIEEGFDTTTALSPEVLIKSLLRQQGQIEVFFRKDFEKAYLSNQRRESLDSFYVKLFKNDMLAITTSDSASKYMPCRFVVILRLNKGVRISSFDGIMKRKAVLEGEIWDKKNIEVVWRAQTSGFEMGKRTDDAQFIANGIKEIFKLFQQFIPLKEVENW